MRTPLVSGGNERTVGVQLSADEFDKLLNAMYRDGHEMEVLEKMRADGFVLIVGIADSPTAFSFLEMPPGATSGAACREGSLDAMKVAIGDFTEWAAQMMSESTKASLNIKSN